MNKYIQMLYFFIHNIVRDTVKILILPRYRPITVPLPFSGHRDLKMVTGRDFGLSFNILENKRIFLMTIY